MGKLALILMALFVLPILASPALGETLWCYIRDPGGGIAISDSADISNCGSGTVQCSAVCTPTSAPCCSMEGQYTWEVYDDPPSFVCGGDTCTNCGASASMTGDTHFVDWDTQEYCTSECTGKSVIWETYIESEEPPTDYVLYYDFDSIEGGQVLDQSENGNHGTVYDAALADGRLDQALELDGLGGYVSADDDDSLNPSSEITISFWIYNEGGQDAGIYKYASCPGSGGSSNSRAYLVRHEYDTGRVFSRVFSSRRDYGDIQSLGTIPLNEWHHIVFTFDSGSAEIYIDGEPDNSEAMGVSSIMNDGHDLTIGGYWSYCDGTDFISKLDGRIDEFRIYDRALEPEEIKALYDIAGGGEGEGTCCGDDADDEPDWGPDSCMGCEAGLNLGSREWDIGGETSTPCCGDDSGEYVRDCQDNDEGLCIQATDSHACCNQEVDCVYDDICYTWYEEIGEWECGVSYPGEWHDIVSPWADINASDEDDPYELLDDPYAVYGIVNLTLDSSDMGSGVAECGLSNDDAEYIWEPCPDGEWVRTGWNLTWNSPGEGVKTIYLQVMDAAGNSIEVSDSIILDVTEPVTWIEPPLPEWTGQESGHWEGNPDGSVKAFNVSWGGWDVSGIACYQVQYNTSTLPWTDWIIEGSGCTPRGEWTFGPLEPLVLQDGENYSFSVRALDNVNKLGGWSPWNTTTLDTLNPELNLTAEDQDGESVLDAGVVSYRDVHSVTVTSYAMDNISGIMENYIYYCSVYGGVEDCRTEYCSPQGPGIISSCSVALDYREDMVIKFRAGAEDYAGNLNMTPGGLDRYFFVTDHALVNFVVYHLDIAMGDGAFLKVQVRNLQEKFDNVTVNISGYDFISFVDTGNSDLSPDRRTSWVGLGPYEEKELMVRVLSSSIGQSFIELNATSSLREDGEPCFGTDCVEDSDIVLIATGYPLEFPGINVWGVFLLIAVSLLVYSGAVKQGLNP